MIPLFKVNMSPNAKNIVGNVLDSGMCGEGPRTEEFQKELSKLWNTSNITLLNSCTAALMLAIKLIGIKNGDNVITTSFTFPATNCAIFEYTKNVTWGPLEKDTLCLDVDKTLELITLETKAVVLTAVGGTLPHKFDYLRTELNKKNIPLVIDAAHAYMTYWDNIHIANLADYVCFSFQAIKHLTTGDGGALVCKDSDLYNRAEKLKWFGMTRKIPNGISRLEHQMSYSIQEHGYKYHMNDINAAIGLANIPLSLESVQKSKENSTYFNLQLDCDKLLNPNKCNSSSWVYGFYINNRDEVIKLLEKDGIIASPLWKNNTEHLCFNGYDPYKKDNKNLLDKIIYIPNGWWVSKEEMEYIFFTLNRVFQC